MSNKKEFFRGRIKESSGKIEELKKRFNVYAISRIVWFVCCAAAAIWTISIGSPMALVLVIGMFLVVFIALVYKHNHVKSSLDLNQKILAINEEEVLRLEYDFKGIYGGDEFADEKHPYTSDLDIFGRNSLFQLINRAETRRGIIKLKTMFSGFSPKAKLEARQEMVKELTGPVDWRQKMQAYGKGEKPKNEQGFTDWLKGVDFIGNSVFYKILPYLMMGFSAILIVAALKELISDYLLFVPIFITGYFLYKIHRYSAKTYEMTDSGVKILASLELMLEAVEQREFAHEQLISLKNKLFTKGLSASQKIKELRKILELLNLRGNMMYHLFNMFFLLDYIFLFKAEKWRSSFASEIDVWFDTIAEFEALNSIAAFSFANESYIFPKITDVDFTFKSKNLGHPLIPPSGRVNNDFAFSGRGSTCVVTGSNMAGKSTFLRTVGINAVLAFSGAPVCADSMEISLFTVFSSMRTKDNLEENISSFYAELLRLKMLLEKANEGLPIFYLLDEILKGTNSVDRHIGAESLILQLNEMNVFGLVSTHDLALGKLSEQNKLITNYNFSSSVIDEEIIFDYKLHPGICQSTNASRLMAKIGIKIKS